MEVAVQLRQLAQKQHGAQQYCWRAFADAMELVSICGASAFFASHVL